MDPIASVNINKDSSVAMLLEAQRRGWELHYMEIQDLYLHAGDGRACMRRLSIKENSRIWYSLSPETDLALDELDVILMRKDPPVNTEYVYATYILERAEVKGTLVINKPQSLRDCNEKIFTTWFSELMPDTLVSSNAANIRNFYQKHGDIILKPLDSMGGKSIFRVKENDSNLSVIIETITDYGKRFCMTQNFLPAIKEGDKRILMVDGEPVPYCLARIPAHGEIRGNLAAGGHGEVRPLSESDRRIAYVVAPTLKKKGLVFVGLDIIGDFLTEINVTSPTCVREIEVAFRVPIASMLIDAIVKRLAAK